MKIFNYTALAMLLMFGLSGCGGWVTPAPYTKNIEPNIVSELSGHEINKILAKNVSLIINDQHQYRVSGYEPDKVNYQYTFGTNSKTINGGMSGSCWSGLKKKNLPIKECEKDSWFQPNDSFINQIKQTKQYFDADKHVPLLSGMNSLKKKLTDCQANIKIPTTKLVENSGKLGDIIKFVRMSDVVHNKTDLFDYINVDSSSFTCDALKDTFTLNLSSNQFKLNSSYNFNYTDIDKSNNKLPDIKLGDVSYQFFKNDYVIEDKFVKVTLMPSSSYSSTIDTKVSIQNLTSEFLELQGISIYYGNEVHEYLGVHDSHLDLAPETTNQIAANKFYKNLAKFISIRSKDDTQKIGLAIKYKVKSTNQIQTLYKTTQLFISELK